MSCCEMEPMIRNLRAHMGCLAQGIMNRAHVVLKLKTRRIQILTRSLTPSSPPSSCEELTSIRCRSGAALAWTQGNAFA